MGADNGVKWQHGCALVSAHMQRSVMSSLRTLARASGERCLKEDTVYGTSLARKCLRHVFRSAELAAPPALDYVYSSLYLVLGARISLLLVTSHVVHQKACELPTATQRVV